MCDIRRAVKPRVIISNQSLSSSRQAAEERKAPVDRCRQDFRIGFVLFVRVVHFPVAVDPQLSTIFRLESGVLTFNFLILRFLNNLEVV